MGANLELRVIRGEELRAVVESHRLAVDLNRPGRRRPPSGPAGTLIVDVHSVPESVRDERLRARDTRDAPADDRHAGLVPGGHAGVNTPAYSDSVGRATQKRTRQPRTNERTREHSDQLGPSG